MVSEEQYALFGKFSFAFNEIELVLEQLIEGLLATPERTVAEKLAGEGSFSAKLNRFRTILQGITADQPSLSGKTEELIRIAGRLEKFSGKRNTYLHAVMLPRDPKTGRLVLIIKQKTREEVTLGEQELNNLIAQAESLESELVTRVSELDEALGQLRTQDGREAPLAGG